MRSPCPNFRFCLTRNLHLQDQRHSSYLFWVLLTDFLWQNTPAPVNWSVGFIYCIAAYWKSEISGSLLSFWGDLQRGGVKEHHIWRGTVQDGRRWQKVGTVRFCFHSVIKQNALKTSHNWQNRVMYTVSHRRNVKKIKWNCINKTKSKLNRCLLEAGSWLNGHTAVLGLKEKPELL